MANLMPVPMMAFFDANGNPLVGGKLFTYLAGSSTPTPSYTDAAGTVANSNPVILNARGEAAVWLDPAISYKFVLQTSAGSVIWTVDGVATGASISDVQKLVGGTLNKSVAGGSNVVLTASEASNGILTFTGALTANINVVVPASPTRDWLVVNNTSGAFTLTVKTAGGTGVAVPQGYGQKVYSDGSNVLPNGVAISATGDAILGSGIGNNHTVNGNSVQTGQARIGSAQGGGGTDINGATIEIAAGTTGDTITLIDFHARAGSDYDARIVRFPGANGDLQITNQGGGVITRITGDILRDVVDSNGNFSRVIPGGSTLYPDFACRAWGNFNGANGAVRASGNATVVRNSVGTYTLSFSRAMPDVNYSISLGVSNNPSNSQILVQDNTFAPTTTSIRLLSFNASNGTLSDPTFNHFSVFR